MQRNDEIVANHLTEPSGKNTSHTVLSNNDMGISYCEYSRILECSLANRTEDDPGIQ